MTAAAAPRAAAIAQLFELPVDAVSLMPSRGVAHDHFRLEDRGLVLRVPRAQALQGLAPADALARQAAAFSRAAVTGRAPRLDGVVPPCDDLPFGALLVQEIIGRPPRLPHDLPAIATALAALHALPLPPADLRAPLSGDSAPVCRLYEFVRDRMGLFEQAALEPAALAVLRGELARAEGQLVGLMNEGGDAVLTLVGADVHPGNFLIDKDGVAVLTDLERAQYGHPGADLAHATLATSTRWDPAVAAALSENDTAAFYAAWESVAGDELAGACIPAFAVTRRLVWLRTLTWMAHWRNGGRTAAPPMPAELLAHMDAHAADVLSLAGVRRIAAELD